MGRGGGWGGEDKKRRGTKRGELSFLYFFLSSTNFYFLSFPFKQTHRVERISVEELVRRDRVGKHVELHDHQREGGVGLLLFLLFGFGFFFF